MTDYAVTALRSPIAAPTGAIRPARDALLSGANGGVRFLFDLDFSWCYPGGVLAGRPAQGSPASGQTIYDVSERSNGTYLRQGSTPVANYAGGGFDFTPVTRAPFGVKGSATSWASIYASTNRYFLWCGYYRMPSSSDWKASNGDYYMLQSSEANGAYISQVDPLVMFQITGSPGNPALVIRRQIAIGASSANASVFSLTPDANYFGRLCQVAFWRNAAGQGFRMKSALAETSTTGAVGTETTLNFSTLSPVWGQSPLPDNGDMSAEDLNASNYRLYRGWLEDLAMSGRDPLIVLNADWSRVQARIAKSAAANSGTSIIFV